MGIMLLVSILYTPLSSVLSPNDALPPQNIWSDISAATASRQRIVASSPSGHCLLPLRHVPLQAHDGSKFAERTLTLFPSERRTVQRPDLC